MLETLKEIATHFTQNKKYWLLPVVGWVLLLGILIVLSSNSVIAPLIYTLF